MRNRTIAWGLAALAFVALGLHVATRQSDQTAAPVRTPEAVGGGVIATPSAAAPQATPEPTASPVAASAPTPEATPAATVAPAAVPTPSLSPTAGVASGTLAGTPAPAAPVAAVADPAAAVSSFYGYVVGGNFDAAYALWNDRMRATYAREPNLDSRFDETAAITFNQLSVAEMSGDSATVQANFTETSEAGSSRQFIGYWRLRLVDGRWLLDEPHY